LGQSAYSADGGPCCEQIPAIGTYGVE
jgi:hypothetical protein